MRLVRRTIGLLVAALAVAAGAGLVAGYAFALRYRRRVGLPHRQAPPLTPDEIGLPFVEVRIPSTGGATLPGWLVPPAGSAAAEARVAPGVVVVHGWESNRGRVLPHAQYLRAAGFHTLLVDARGHGDNPPERLPITAGEFAADAAAAVRWLAARPDVAGVGLLGHSMGGAAALVAAANEPCVEAVAAMSAPSDPVRLARQTFVLAELPLPEPLAWPLAWLTARVLLAPRGHSVEDVSAAASAARYRGPILLVHGALDRAVPVEHLEILAEAATRRRGAGSAPVETLVLPEHGHRLLYESPACRRAVAGFFAAALGGLSTEIAGDLAAATEVTRPPNPPEGFGALGGGPKPADRLPAPPAARRVGGSTTD